MAATLPIFSWFNENTYQHNIGWTYYGSFAPGNFTAGHRYAILACCSLYSPNTDVLSQGRIVIGSTEVCFASTDGNAVLGGNVRYRQVNFMHMFTADGSSYIYFQGRQVGSSGSARIRKFRFIAIDLDVDNNSFPQNSRDGWIWDEYLGNVTLGTAWSSHNAVGFTPDGVSDYLVIASLRVNNYLGTANSHARLYHYQNAVELCYSSTIPHAAGSDWTHGLATYMQSPPSTYTLIQAMARNAVAGYGYGTIEESKFLVLKLNCFTSQAAAFDATQQQYADTSPHTLVSCTPSPAPSIGDTMLLFRRVETPSWIVINHYYQNEGYEGPLDIQHDIVDWNGVSPSVGMEEGSWFLDLVTVGQSNPTYDMRVTNGQSNSPQYRNALVAAMKAEVKFIEYEDASANAGIVVDGSADVERTREPLASSLIDVSATAAPSKLVGFVAASLINTVGNAAPSMIRGVSAGSDIDTAASALIQRLRSSDPLASILFTANAQVNLASAIPLPSVNRSFSDVGELRPAELTEGILVGDDTPGVNNRLVVVAPGQFGIDPAYVPPGGVPYTFAGPPNGSTNPIQLGFKPGDKILLKQAQGQPVGPNVNKMFTLYEPASLAVLEAFDYPDSTAYKFYAIRRGV